MAVRAGRERPARTGAEADPPEDPTGGSDRVLRDLDAALPVLVAELKDVHALIDAHEDADKILGGLVAAIVSQEFTVMAIANRSMVVDACAAVAKDQLILDWRALIRHYAKTKYEAVFDNGANQLARLTDEESREVIHRIRQLVEPMVNQEMGHTESSIKLEISLRGPIKVSAPGMAVEGSRAGIRRHQGRVVRALVQGSLWFSVGFWAIHWTSWTLFGAAYLASIWSHSPRSPVPSAGLHYLHRLGSPEGGRTKATARGWTPFGRRPGLRRLADRRRRKPAYQRSQSPHAHKR